MNGVSLKLMPKLNKKYWDKIKVLLILIQNQICRIKLSQFPNEFFIKLMWKINQS